MKLLTITLAFCSILGIMLSAACSSALQEAAQKHECKSLACFQRAALKGDVDAAQFVEQRVPMAEKPYWVGILAENGDPDGAYGYALTLVSQGVREECYRAIYWADIARRSGVDGASELHTTLLEQSAEDFECGCSSSSIEPHDGCPQLKTADLEKYDPANRIE